MVSRAETESLVTLLQSSEFETRKRALDRLQSWQGKSFDPDALRVLLAGATHEYPKVAGTWPTTPNEPLVTARWKRAQTVPPRLVSSATLR